MNRSLISGIAALVAVLSALGPVTGTAQPVKSDPWPGNPLFYGEWYSYGALERLAKGKTWVDMVTVRLTPGEAVTRRGAQVTLRREFELIKDFGDRMIVAMTTSQPGSEIRTTMVGALTLDWEKIWYVETQSYKGPRALRLTFHHCYAPGNSEFSEKVLNESGAEARWARILKFIDHELISGVLLYPQLRWLEPCAIDQEGTLVGDYTVITYYRFPTPAEQQKLDAGELEIARFPASREGQ